MRCLRLAKDLSVKYDFICIDEFEVHDIADAMIVGRLFKLLRKANVNFLLTSNSKPSELYKNGLQRETFKPFIAMLEKEFTIFPLNTKHDYRLDQLSSDRRVFFPLDKKVEGYDG
jgi:cell division protein ZapE